MKVLLVDDDVMRARLLEGALRDLGHDIIAQIDQREDLLASVRRTQPDIIIVDVESPERDTLEDMHGIQRDMPRPVLMFTHDGDPHKMRTALRAGVSAYVVKGLEVTRVKPILDVAIARFTEHQALRRELQQASTQLAQRKQIERAKGILMQQRSCSEDMAYRALRKMAMDRSRSVAEVAAEVIAAERLLASS